MTRHAAIEELIYIKESFAVREESYEALDMGIKALEPKEIGYVECASALLKMWLDDILTDSEYGKIMYKLNENLKKDLEEGERKWH